jgi:hypothetical protein
MSGPPVPRFAPGAAPGQNGIGTFIIGSSPIGDIPAWDPWAQIVSQYGNSDAIDALILSFNSALDQTQNIESLYDSIWNIQTAIGYGQDVIGRIVGVSRTLKFPGNVNYLGFEEATSFTGFGQGGFYSGGGTTTNFVLSDGDFRTLLFAKAAANITDGSIPSVNQILLTLFKGRGKCFVADGLNMSLTYTFQFQLNPVELAIIQQSNVLPSAAGIIVNVSST